MDLNKKPITYYFIIDSKLSLTISHQNLEVSQTKLRAFRLSFSIL